MPTGLVIHIISISCILLLHTNHILYELKSFILMTAYFLLIMSANPINYLNTKKINTYEIVLERYSDNLIDY